MSQFNNTKKHTSAVVLGLGINSLAFVRSLAEEGIRVCGIYVSDDEFGRYSRYCGAIRFPDIRNSEEFFLQKLIKTSGNIKERPVLYAESDLYVMFMSRHRKLLEKYFRFLLPDHVLLENLSKKNLASTYVSEKGLMIPFTHIFGKRQNVKEIIDTIDFPCLMKPLDSFTVNIGRKNIIFTDKKSLSEFLLKHPDLVGNVIIQQIIPGGDSNTYQATTYVSEDGTILPIFTMRKIRQWRPDFGITSYGISEDVPEIKKMVNKFLALIKYKGLISIEFKKHPDTGDYYYIETNPRLPYYHSLVNDSGFNYPYIYYQDMLGFNVLSTLSTQQKDGIRWISFSTDSASFMKKYMNNEITIRDWIVSIFKSRSYAYFDRKDIKPFCYSCIQYVRRLSYNIAKRIFHIISINSVKTAEY